MIAVWERIRQVERESCVVSEPPAVAGGSINPIKSKFASILPRAGQLWHINRPLPQAVLTCTLRSLRLSLLSNLQEPRSEE